MYILDERGNPLPINEIGLMYAGGLCVSRGYLNLPYITEQKYVLDKFTNDGYAFHRDAICVGECLQSS